MKKKQTAVEWLVNTINDKIDYIPIKYWDNIRIIIEQAKQMEKEQIINAHGIKEKKSSGISNYVYKYSGEEYYNETYKSE